MDSATKKNIEDTLTAEIALILSKDANAIARDESLHSMGMDSLSFVELLVSIESNFNLTLVNTNLDREDFSTIANLARRIYEELHEK
ncbi:MAG: acyl carrier protein [Candidatus Omnitrophica bacterium]|nr:acyl carrier protein [Candidatus Omnitrophota bacterium]